MRVVQAFALLSLLLGACGHRDGYIQELPGSACSAGLVYGCYCGADQPGLQTCDDVGVLGQCECTTAAVRACGVVEHDAGTYLRCPGKQDVALPKEAELRAGCRVASSDAGGAPWIDCGDGGLAYVPLPPLRVDAGALGPVLDGSFVVRNAADLHFLQAFSTIVGNLTITGEGLLQLTLPDLERVEGELIVGGVSDGAVIRLPRLVHAGALGVNADEGVLELPALRTVEGDVQLYAREPRSLELPVLEKVGGHLRLTVHAGRVELPALRRVGAGADIALPAQTLSLPALVEVAPLDVHGPALTTLSLPSLVETTTLRLRTPLLQNLAMPALERIDTLDMVQRAALTHVDLRALQTAGSLELLAYDDVEEIRLDALASATTVTLSVTAPFELQLDAMSALRSLHLHCATAVLPPGTTLTETLTLAGTCSPAVRGVVAADEVRVGPVAVAAPDLTEARTVVFIHGEPADLPVLQALSTVHDSIRFEGGYNWGGASGDVDCAAMLPALAADAYPSLEFFRRERETVVDCAGVTRIRGDLSLRDNAVAGFDFSGLQAVDGSLVLAGNYVGVLRFPTLTSLGGALDLGPHPRLVELSAPGLGVPAHAPRMASLTISDQADLDALLVDTPALLGGDLILQAPDVDAVSVPGLRYVSGTVRVSHAATTDVSLPDLQAVGELRIDGAEQLRSLELPALRYAEDAHVCGNPRLPACYANQFTADFEVVTDCGGYPGNGGESSCPDACCRGL